MVFQQIEQMKKGDLTPFVPLSTLVERGTRGER
jgi:hypothetical protein